MDANVDDSDDDDEKGASDELREGKVDDGLDIDGTSIEPGVGGNADDADDDGAAGWDGDDDVDSPFGSPAIWAKTSRAIAMS